MSYRLCITVFLFLFVLAGCNRESYSRSNSGFSSVDKKVLYDFRAAGSDRDQQSAANLGAPAGATIIDSYDLNGDGKKELLLQEVAGGPGGRQTKIARLVEFDKGKLVTVEDFGQVYDDACAGGGSLSASTIYYLPPPAGQKARFTIELYRAPCPPKNQQPQWTRLNAK
jgi:hypothetical protein